MVSALPANSQPRIVFDYLKIQVALNPELSLSDMNSLMDTIPEKRSNHDRC